MNLKIAILVRSFPTTSETFVVTQIAYLLSKGHEVDIYAMQVPAANQVRHQLVDELNMMQRVTYRPELPDGLLPRLRKGTSLLIGAKGKLGKALHTLDFFRYGKLASSLDLLFTAQPFLKPRKYDIIHCHFGPMGVKAAALKSLGLLSGKLMVTFHGYDVMDKAVLSRKGYYDLMIEKTDMFTANSSYTVNKAIEMGIPAEKIHRLPMGLDTSKFIADPTNRKKEDSVVRFITIGRLVEVKGFEYAIRAVGKLVHETGFRNLHLQIIGYGTLYKELQQLITDLNLQEFVELAGSKTQEEVKQLFEEADVFVLPGIKASNGAAEAQGLVIQEAQAMQLPVLVSDVGGMPEGMLDGKTGFLVPEKDVNVLAEKMLLLAQDASLREQMGREGRLFVESNFDYRQLGRQLEALYFQMLDKR